MRVGNDAVNQTQHDVYGSVILSASQMFFDERLPKKGDQALFSLLEPLGTRAHAAALTPDAGIWEYRDKPAVHTYSAAMCWVACDRLARIAARLALPDRAAHWRKLADELRGNILERAWNAKLNCYAGHLDSDHIDASSLLLAEIGLVAPDDPRFISTVENDRPLARPQRLSVPLRRAGRFRRADDGLRPLQLLVCRRARGDRPHATRRAACSKRSWRAATMSACCPKTSTPPPANCGAIFRRPIRLSASSSLPCGCRKAGTRRDERHFCSRRRKTQGADVRAAANILFVALGIVAALLVALGVAMLASAVINNWARRDIELQTSITFRSISGQLASAAATDNGAELAPMLDRLAGDDRILALAVCGAKGKLLHATPTCPRDFPARACLCTRAAPSLAAWPAAACLSAFTRLATKARRGALSLRPIPIFSGAASTNCGSIAFLDLLGVGVGFGLLTLAVVQVMRRSWLKSLAQRHRQRASRRGAASTSSGSTCRSTRRSTRCSRNCASSANSPTASTSNGRPKPCTRCCSEELPGAQVMVVSNREPYIHNHVDGEIALQIPASGLVSALEPVMRACGGVWIAHGCGSADRETCDAQRPGAACRPTIPPIRCAASGSARRSRTAIITASPTKGCGRSAISPSCGRSFASRIGPFIAPSIGASPKPSWRRRQREDPIVLVQDYHFAMLPRMIRERLPRATIITFWHIPWPNAETFGICPWRKEIIDGSARQLDRRLSHPLPLQQFSREASTATWRAASTASEIR